jgi:molecular chaperone Hsp33
MTDLPDTDYTQRFIFDDSDTRGELVALERSYAEVLAKHPIRSRSRNCWAS